MTAMKGRRIAVVLFNLGGPDDQASVKPFLFNLFNDPAIIGLPGFARTPLARLISSRRETSAQANYALMGGGSPLLPGTRKQAEALEAALAARLAGDEVKTFIAMRYWRPLTEETAADVAVFGPDEVVLLPLYPQFSTTTTESLAEALERGLCGVGREPHRLLLARGARLGVGPGGAGEGQTGGGGGPAGPGALLGARHSRKPGSEEGRSLSGAGGIDLRRHC
jgi:protoheme ferro-lyase